jgi:8-oxo-dGTP diphosphatase
MEQGLKYTLCFIRRKDEILMLNRQKPSWMGMWNGVGGRMEEGESPQECVIREVFEETDIKLSKVCYSGVVTWEDNGKDFGGMHVFLADVPDDYIYTTPRGTQEGVLDWKTIEWLFDSQNTGVIKNIQRFLPEMIKGETGAKYHCVYSGNELREFKKDIID